MSRLVASPELVGHIDSDPWAFDPNESVQLVFVRDRKTKDDIEFDSEHPTAVTVQRRLEKLNRLNSQYTITCKVSDGWGNVSTRQLRPLHYAIFTDDFSHHGRIYTGEYGHQNLASIERRTIQFDSEPSVELDYSGLHTRMIYHLEGIDFTHDPYRLWDRQTTPELRYVAKVVVNAGINARTHTATISACNHAMSTKTEDGQRKQGKALSDAIRLYDAYRRTGITFVEVFDLAIRRHRRIAEYFGSDAGLRLMNLDGKIALDILSHFADRSIPCLGVHDSFVVPRHVMAELREVMLRMYRKRLHFEPQIK